MSLDAAILGFLCQRPRSGYDLKTRCFDDAARDFWTADQAQIYRTLERLQSARLVSSSRKRQAGKPDRRIYTVTPAGREAHLEWLRSDVPLAPPREPFLLQLYFGAGLADDELLDLVRARRASHQRQLDRLRADAVATSQDVTVPARDATLRGAAFDAAIAGERGAIDHLDDLLDAIEAGQLPVASGGYADSQGHALGAEPA